MKSTWARRELPVLRYLVERFDDVDLTSLQLAEVEAGTGLSGDDVKRALRALAEAAPPFLQGQTVAELTYPIIVSGVTERARRAVGQWPSAEQLVDELAAGLEAAADREPDPERASKLRSLGRGISGALRDVVVDVAGAAATRSMGMG